MVVGRYQVYPLLLGQNLLPVWPVRLLDPLNIGSQVGEPSFGLLAKEVVWWKDVEDEDKEAEGAAVDQAGSVAHDVRFASQVVCNGLQVSQADVVQVLPEIESRVG